MKTGTRTFLPFSSLIACTIKIIIILFIFISIFISVPSYISSHCLRNRRKCISPDLYKCDAVWTRSKVPGCSCISRFTHRAWSHVVSSAGSMKNTRARFRMSTVALVVVFDRLGNCIANFIFAMHESITYVYREFALRARARAYTVSAYAML